MSHNAAGCKQLKVTDPLDVPAMAKDPMGDHFQRPPGGPFGGRDQLLVQRLPPPLGQCAVVLCLVMYMYCAATITKSSLIASESSRHAQ